MVKVELPYNFGTFVKVKNKDGTTEYCGTVIGYTVSDGVYLVWVSGYNESVTGEFLPDMIEPMTEKEIEELKEKYK